MSKTILATAIQDATQLSSSAAAHAATAAIEAIITELKASGRFILPGFGTLSVHALPARPGRNPGTGTAIEIAASRTVRFKPAPALREILTAAAQPKKAAKTRPTAAKPPAKTALRRKAARTASQAAA